MIHRPASLDELRETVAHADRIRAVGSRHSFGGITEGAELVSLDALPDDVVVDRDSGTVSFGAGMTYGTLATVIDRAGLALHNLASLPHITVGGAIATATHGSGDQSGNLATAVRVLQLVTSHGDVAEFARGDPDFDGAVVGLGSLGIVTRITLDVEPAYEMCQDVFQGLSWDALAEHCDDVFAAADSVSVFTSWDDAVAGDVWVKQRSPGAERHDLFGAGAATVDRHPVRGLDPASCTAQLGHPGRWFERLPHFRMGFTPSVGEELQSEFLVPREDAIGAIETVRGLSDVVRPVLQISELRTVARDGLWMSPEYGRDTFGVHFTWTTDRAGVLHALERLEPALAAFDARPHWGKLFRNDGHRVSESYEKLPDFVSLAERLDPRGAFRNDWFDRHIAGES